MIREIMESATQRASQFIIRWFFYRHRERVKVVFFQIYLFRYILFYDYVLLLTSSLTYRRLSVYTGIKECGDNNRFYTLRDNMYI